MTIKEKKYLSDMMRAISLIESFTANTRSYTEYTMDLKTQSAVERQLAIIGEALNQYDKQPERISLNNTRQIVGFRNRIIHDRGVEPKNFNSYGSRRGNHEVMVRDVPQVQPKVC